MIRTLFKHEFLRTWRWLLLVTLAAALVVSVMSGGAMLLPAPLNTVLAIVSAVVVMGYQLALPLLISLDFYRSCYSKTGYFTAAIPARGATIFKVKAAYAYLVSLLGVGITLGLALVASIGAGGTVGASPRESFAKVSDAVALIGSLPTGVSIALAVTVLLYPVVCIAPFFFAATVGSQGWINRQGFGGVVLTWFLFYSASQLLGMLSLFVPPSVDLRNYPDISLIWDPLTLFTVENNALVLPVAVFVTMFLVAIVAMSWAKVSYSRKLELR